MIPPFEMPVAYTRRPSIGSSVRTLATIWLMKATSSMFSRPGWPQHPPPPFQALASPLG